MTDDNTTHDTTAGANTAPAQATTPQRTDSPVIFLQEEKDFLIALQNAIEKNENPVTLLIAGRERLLSIAQKDPGCLGAILASARDARDAKEEGSLDSAHYNTLVHHINSALGKDVNPDGVVMDAAALASIKAGKVNSFLIGVLTALAGVGAGARILQEFPNAQDAVSRVTRHVGAPLSPQDQANAILKDPDALNRLVEHFRTHECVYELELAISAGDPGQKAAALASLKIQMARALEQAGHSHQNAGDRLRGIGR